MAFNPKALPARVYEVYKQGVGLWPLVVERAIEAKIIDTNKVTDIMFHLHHPERKGRSLGPDETDMINEWKGFRALIRGRVEAAASAGPVSSGAGGRVEVWSEATMTPEGEISTSVGVTVHF